MKIIIILSEITIFLSVQFVCISASSSILYNILSTTPNETLCESRRLCVVEIARRYFRVNSIVTISLPLSDTATKMSYDILRQLHDERKWTVLTRKSSMDSPVDTFYKVSRGYIIQINNLYELDDSIYYLRNVAWNPHAKFIVITNIVFEDRHSALSHMIEVFWRNHVINFVILLPEINKEDINNVYIWYPYEGKSCGDNFTRPILINRCSFGAFETGKEIFPEKIPKDLHGCSVRVRTVVWPPYVLAPKHGLKFTKGMEISLLNTIAEKTNFKLIYSVSNKTQDWGVIQINGSSNGLLKSIKEESVDLGIGSLAGTFYRFVLIEPSVSYMTETLSWCVQRAKIKEKWFSVFDALPTIVWFVLVIILTFVSILIWALSHNHKEESTSYRFLHNAIINTYAIFISLSIKIKPKRQIVRILFVFWAIFSLHITSFFQTSLIDFMIRSHYEPQIDKFNKIIEKNFTLRYNLIAFPYISYPDPDVWTDQFLLDTGIICYDADQCLNLIANGNGSIAFLVPRLYLKYSDNKYRDRSGKSLLYTFKDNYMFFPIHMYTYKGYPLFRRINFFIGLIMQSGLQEKWEQMVRQTFTKNDLVESSDSEEKRYALRLENFQGAFMIFAFGVSIAIIVFVFEFILSRYKYKKRGVIPYSN